MKLWRLNSFKKDYAGLPPAIKKQADKQLVFFIQNPKHPSLNIKKMEDPRNIWEGRITKSYRFTFQIQKDIYILRRIGKHDILKNP